MALKVLLNRPQLGIRQWIYQSCVNVIKRFYLLLMIHQNKLVHLSIEYFHACQIIADKEALKASYKALLAKKQRNLI